MAAAARQDLMRVLGQEAGDTGPPDVLVEAWDAHPACCGVLHLHHAAQGDTKTLHTMRTGMGLPVGSDTPC
jgi:hypothetical protein